MDDVFVCRSRAAGHAPSRRMSRRRCLDGEMHLAFGLCHVRLMLWDRNTVGIHYPFHRLEPYYSMTAAAPRTRWQTHRPRDRTPGQFVRPPALRTRNPLAIIRFSFG